MAGSWKSRAVIAILATNSVLALSGCIPQQKPNVASNGRTEEAATSQQNINRYAGDYFLGKYENISVTAIDNGEGWCRPNLSLKITSDGPLDTAKMETFLLSLGVSQFKYQCSIAQSASYTATSSTKPSVVNSGTILKSQDWRSSEKMSKDAQTMRKRQEEIRKDDEKRAKERAREEAERDRREQRENAARSRCEHLYAGKVFTAPGGILSLNQQYEVVGFSPSLGKATVRSVNSDYRQEIYCSQIRD